MKAGRQLEDAIPILLHLFAHGDNGRRDRKEGRAD